MRSMVGSPQDVDLKAFPKFKDAVGHYATLKDCRFSCLVVRLIASSSISAQSVQAGDLLYLQLGISFGISQCEWPVESAQRHESL